MPRYHVRFMKTVPDSTGHEHYICQFETVVEAKAEDDARSEAKVRFCCHKHIPQWSTHADALEVEQLPERQAARERDEVLRGAWAFLG